MDPGVRGAGGLCAAQGAVVGLGVRDSRPRHPSDLVRAGRRCPHHRRDVRSLARRDAAARLRANLRREGRRSRPPIRPVGRHVRPRVVLDGRRLVRLLDRPFSSTSTSTPSSGRCDRRRFAKRSRSARKSCRQGRPPRPRLRQLTGAGRCTRSHTLGSPFWRSRCSEREVGGLRRSTRKPRSRTKPGSFRGAPWHAMRSA